uniref:Extracellular solute-binding protein n=1 Tax=Thermorudis peleae TaxID=1382356 RepID=A0A831X6K7_9BACT
MLDTRFKLTRRAVLVGALSSAAGLLLAACGETGTSSTPTSNQTSSGGQPSPSAPAVISGVTLRVVGTGVTLLEPIRTQAEQDLGIKLEYDVKDGPGAQQKAVTQPQAWDLYDQWFNSVKIVWGSGVAAPIDVTRLPDWPKLMPLTTEGRLCPDAREGDGDAPFRLLYVQSDWTLGSNKTDNISMLPLTFNVDSFGYNTDKVTEEDAQSWSIFFSDKYAGAIGLYSDPSTGLMDLALGAQAAGLMTFQNIGNMSQQEIDGIMKLLIDYKKRVSSVPSGIPLMSL